MLRPGGKDVLNRRGTAVGEKLLKLPDRGHVLELSLIQVHLMALFQSTHEFDAIERRQV